MKILFAAPDRDLLASYQKLLETDFGEVVTAFDGTQVLSLLSGETFDLVILDRLLPRVELKRLLYKIREKVIPVIELTLSPLNVRLLTEEPLASAFLPYPFTREALSDLIRLVSERSRSAERFTAAGVPIDAAAFGIENGPGLSLGEIDVLRVLSSGANAIWENRACIAALNAKFARVGSPARIRYQAKKGFELVTENE